MPEINFDIDNDSVQADNRAGKHMSKHGISLEVKGQAVNGKKQVKKIVGQKGLGNITVMTLKVNEASFHVALEVLV